MKFNTYFSARFILSKLSIWNIVFSDRSDGKTFDCKVRALEDYEKDKSITIYMRRFKTEITDKLYNSFFDEIFQNSKDYDRFKNWIFKGSKKGIQVKTSLKGEWDWIILFVPLSIAGRLKSQISEVHRIHTIDFDEYIPLDLRYLKDEVSQLLEFWKTIDRDRETTQLIILGNRITPFNPIFDYFGLEMQISKDKLKLYKNGTIAVQLYSNKEHREKREQGKFREMVKGTSYESYDTGGILQILNIKKTSKNGLEYLYSFKTERGEGSVWSDGAKIVVSESLRKDGFILTDKVYNIKREQYMCNYQRFNQLIKLYYKTGNLYFESEKAFYLFEKILLKVGAL